MTRVRLLEPCAAYGIRHAAGSVLEVHAEREHGLEVYFGPGRTYVGTLLRSAVEPVAEAGEAQDLTALL